MIVLGIDPGATIGWCLYDDERKMVLTSGTFTCEAIGDLGPLIVAAMPGRIVIESMIEPRGNIYPAVVVTAIYEGEMRQIVRSLGKLFHSISRHDVKRRLTDATLGTVVCKKDGDVWAALKLLHGCDGCDKKGGPLYGVKSHARAALAAAVAWGLPAVEKKQSRDAAKEAK